MTTSIRNKTRLALTMGVAASALAYGAPALARQTAEAPVANVALEEIVVTARKRAETLETAPLSVAAVSGEKISQQGVTTLEQLSSSMPNVQIGRSAQTASINIRGIGSGGNRGFEQSVGMYIDGVYMARSRQFLQPMIDLERVEVLRGPQGTLFGKNTVAGAVNIITATPTPGAPFAYDFTADTEPKFDTYRATGILSGSIGENLGLRLAGRWETTDGYVHNEQRHTDEAASTTKFLRGSLAWEPTDAVKVVARLGYTKSEVDGTNRVIRVFNPALGVGLPINSRIAVIAAPFANPKFGASDGGAIGKWTSFTGNLNESPNDTDDQKILNGSVNATWDLGWGQLTSVTGYTSLKYDLVHDVDFLPVNLVQNHETEDFDQASQELRLAFEKRGHLSGIVGAYYETQDLLAGATTKVDGTMGGLAQSLIGRSTLFAGVIPGAGLTLLPAIGRSSTFDQDATTLAVFGEATWAFTDSFRADFGLRWSQDEKDVALVAGLFGSDPNVLAVLPSGVATGALTPAETTLLRSVMGSSFATYPHDQDLSRKEKHVTPTVNLQWDLAEGAMGYLSWSRGFKSGGFNFSPDSSTPAGAPGPGTEFEDETVEAWELGLKSKFFDNRARASVALFRSDYENLQVTSFRGTSFVVGNAAAVRSQGLEAEGEVAASSWMTVGGALSYLDSSYSSFANAACTIQQQAATPVGCKQDLTGKTTPFAPKWSSTVHVDLKHQVGDALIARARVDANYRSELYLDGTLDPNVLQGGYTKFNARLSIGADSGRWEVAVFGRNLTNEATYTASVNAPLGAGAFMASIEEPRTVGLQLRIKN